MRDKELRPPSFGPVAYGAGAIAFHWLAALLIIFQGVVGLLIGGLPRTSQLFWVTVHGDVGLLYLTLVIARLLWRLSHRPPDLPPDVGEFSRRTSYPVHLLLYALMLCIPLVGIVAFVWHGRVFDFALFRIDLGVASNPAVFHKAEDVHAYLAYGLFGLATVHALAALWHHFIRRDGILLRMLPGR